MNSDCPQLEELRILVDKIYSFNRVKPSNYEGHVRPLVICLEEYLRNEKGIADKDERREYRLYIYEAIVRKPITTTYDLPAYQCVTISNYLEEFEPPDTYEISGDGKQLLEYLTRNFEAGVASFESSDTEQSDGVLSSVSNLPF